jgi:transposase
MFGIGPATRIYLAAGATDMRKNFEGLYGLVRNRLECDPLSGHVFLFSNAQRNRLKLLFWAGLKRKARKAKSPSATKNSCCFWAVSIWRRPVVAHGIA